MSSYGGDSAMGPGRGATPWPACATSARKPGPGTTTDSADVVAVKCLGGGFGNVWI